MKSVSCVVANGLTLGFIGVFLGGCAGTSSVIQQETKSGTTEQKKEPAAVPEVRSLSGKIVDTMNAGAYTYINLEKDGKAGWIAIPFSQVSIGQEVKVRPGTEMGKFTSKSLNRTFDSILFSAGLIQDENTVTSPPTAAPAPVVQPPLPQGHPPMGGTPPLQGHVDMMEQPGNGMPILSGKVVETMDSGGYTYVQLENNGKKIWAAVPAATVAVGQNLSLLPGQTMTNFNSKSLNKTFDSIIFSGGVLPEK